MAFLGGHRLTSARWVSTNAIAVAFEAPADGLYRQLYAGKTMIGVTAHPDDREVVGQLSFTEWPQLLSLVAVDGTEKLTDFGGTFGQGPWNKATLAITVSGYPDDANRIEITAGTTPSGAVDPDNLIGTVILEGDGTYHCITQPLQGSGTFHLAATPYDDKPDGGNAGTPATGTVDVVAMPPDVVLQDDGSRMFDVTIAAQTLNISVILP